MTAVWTVALLALLTVYAGAAAASFFGPVDRWLRTHGVGGRPLRSMLPFWGLFAQRFGMFDLDVSYRVVPDPRVAGPDDIAEEWRQLTENRWRWWSFLWRPQQRTDQTSQIIALRVLAAGDLRATPLIRDHPAYRRLVAAVRNTVDAAPGSLPPDEADHLRFRVQLSHGQWTTVPTTTVFASYDEPLRAHDVDGTDTERNRARGSDR